MWHTKDPSESFPDHYSIIMPNLSLCTYMQSLSLVIICVSSMYYALLLILYGPSTPLHPAGIDSFLTSVRVRMQSRKRFPRQTLFHTHSFVALSLL